MGIKWFDKFMKTHPASLLTPYDVCNQYIVIDGSEIKYQLYSDVEKKGRSNYAEYRENIENFFSALDKCGIKPIVVFDGFKFENNIPYYTSSRKKKIGIMKEAIDGASKEQSFIKPLLSEMVFKRTTSELNIPCIYAQEDSDQDLAALAKIINAPILAMDTVFPAYSIKSGFIPLSTFKWKQPQTIDGQRSIPAKILRIDGFIEKFKIDQEAIRFLAILFQQRNFEQFKEFRTKKLETVRIPSYLTYSSSIRFKRPNSIENCLIWFAKVKKPPTERIIDSILSNLPPQADPEKVRIKINADLQKYKNPRIKVKLLRKLQENIFDTECRNRLEVGIQEFVDDEVRNDENEDPIFKQLEQILPGESMDILLSHMQGTSYNTFLALISTDPDCYYESPHKVAAPIRKEMYSLLVGPSSDSVTVTEFDRVGLNYEKIDDYTVNRNSVELSIFYTHESKDDDLIEKRRSFLLKVLIENQEHRDRFEKNVLDISDDLKLTLASTIYWINKTETDAEVVDALVTLFAILQLKQTNEETHVESLLQHIKERAGDDYFNLDILHLSGQWEACLKDSVNLNQVLFITNRYPFPLPNIGKLFSGCLLEQVYFSISTDQVMFQEELKKINGLEELKGKIDNILHIGA